MQYYIYTLFHTSSSMCPRNYLPARARSCGVSTHRCRTLPPVSACPPATDAIHYWVHPRLDRSCALLPAYSSGRARLLTVVHALLRPCVLRRAVSAELLPYSVEPPLRLVPARAHARGKGPASEDGTLRRMVCTILYPVYPVYRGTCDGVQVCMYTLLHYATTLLC